MGKLITTTTQPSMPMSKYLHDALRLLDAGQHPPFVLDECDDDPSPCARFPGSAADRLTLTALLRICHALADEDPATSLLAPGAFTVIEASETSLLAACEVALRNGLLRAVNPDGQRPGGYTLLRHAPAQHKSPPTFEDLLSHAIAQPAPVVVVTQTVTAVPRQFRAAMTRHLKLPKLSKALLLEHLRIVHPCSRTSDEDLLADMPEDARLGRLSPMQLVSALRQPCRTAVVRKLREIAHHNVTDLTFPRLNRIRGLSATRVLLEQTARDLHSYQAGRVAWQDVPRGLLFYGPPGTGKTAAVRALARDADLHLQSCSLARWQSAGHLGDMLKAMRADFATARENAPSILFIDEIDSIADRAQTTGHNATYDVTVTNAVIEQLDGIEQNEGVIVIGACNAPDRLDAALIRSGRFDHHLEFSLPDRRAIHSMLVDALEGSLDDVVLARASDRLIGQTGADVAAVVRAAQALARSRGIGSKLVAKDLDAVLAKYAPAQWAQEETLWRCAVHEAGHVLALTDAGRGFPKRVEIGPGGGRVTGAAPCAEDTLAAFEAELLILMAGRAAEFVVLGCVSAGSGGAAGSDLARATELATAIDGALGLGQAGLVWTDPAKLCIMKDKRLRRAVQRRLVRAETAAITLIEKHKDQIERIAKALLAQRSLDRHDLAKLFEAGSTAGTKASADDKADADDLTVKRPTRLH